jgi:antitoxin YefM
MQGEKMKKITATNARKDFFELIKRVTHAHKIFHISHKNGSVVLMSEEEYDNLIETLDLLSIPGFRKSIQRSVTQMKKGETFSFDEVFGESE